VTPTASWPSTTSTPPGKPTAFTAIATPLTQLPAECGPAFFFGSFFLLGGWRDGGTGFAFCLLKAGYFTQIACRLRDLEQDGPQESLCVENALWSPPIGLDSMLFTKH